MSDSGKYVALYEQAIALYLHEDNLCSSKVSKLLYLNAGLGASLSIAGAKDQFHWICFAGAVMSLMFGLSLLYGRWYLIHRKENAYALAKKVLDSESDSELLPTDPPNKRIGATSLIMCVFAGILGVAWTILGFANWPSAQPL